MAQSGWSENNRALFDHRDERARHVFADFERALDFADVIYDALVEADIIDERRRPRRRADAADAAALSLMSRIMAQQPQLGQHHGIAKRGEALAHRLAVRLAGEHLLSRWIVHR